MLWQPAQHPASGLRGRAFTPVNQPEHCKILLLDREVAVRASLARLLSRETGLELRDASLKTQEWPTDFQPDVVVISTGRADQIEHLRSMFPHTRVLGRLSALRPELWNHPQLDATVDDLAPYPILLAAIRRLGNHHAS